MAFNIRPGGKSESVPVVSTVNSGDVVRIGNFVGIAEIDAEEGRDEVFYTTLALEGIANVPVTGTLEVGQPVYTTTAAPTTSNPGVVATLVSAPGTDSRKLVGLATRRKTASGAGTTWIKLVQGTATGPAA